MGDSNTLSGSEPSLALSPSVKSSLKNWEDYVSYCIQLNDANNALSWIKADVFLALVEQFGDNSLKDFAREINEAPSTVTNYIRVARAFPADSRVAELSFTHHFQAAFADPYDETKGEFMNNSRFDWVEKAVSEMLPTRQLQAEIQVAKQTANSAFEPPVCVKCGLDTPGVREYIFYSPGFSSETHKYLIHSDCYQKIIQYIENPT